MEAQRFPLRLMEWITTTVVLQRLKDSDEAAWELFTARFRGPLVGFARRLGLGEGEAEDVAQETLLAFLDAFRKGGYDRGRGRLGSWLFGIAHRRVLAAKREAARRAEKLGEAADADFFSRLADEESVRRTWDETWAKALLEQGLSQVKAEVEPATWRMFVEVVRKERAPAEVAREMGLSRNAVFIAKHRVLKRLRQLQEELDGLDG
jgi:RNA polymerase sigma-70 factor (ECF subfamily)